jgi:hypothetical protein
MHVANLCESVTGLEDPCFEVLDLDERPGKGKVSSRIKESNAKVLESRSVVFSLSLLVDDFQRVAARFPLRLTESSDHDLDSLFVLHTESCGHWDWQLPMCVNLNCI